jgi:ABC-2 type transport system ATP-binding protein
MSYGDANQVIETLALTKQYGSIVALRSLELRVRKGEVYGLLGPNGSGKTTAIRLLLGLLRPTSGTSRVAGLDSWSQSVSVRRLVSYLPGELRLMGSQSGYALLKFLSMLRGGEALERAVTIAEGVMKLDLRRKVRNYSTGMKQKLALAQAFADPVDILILDEPTSALDPSARSDVLNLIGQARRAGQTVIFSGHVLAEVEEVADRVAIMRRGQLMHVEDMHARSSGIRLLLLRFGGDIPEAYPEHLDLALRERKGDTLLLEHRGQVGPLLAWLQEVGVVDLAIGTDDLKSLYDLYHGPNVKEEEEPTL